MIKGPGKGIGNPYAGLSPTSYIEGSHMGGVSIIVTYRSRFAYERMASTPYAGIIPYFETMKVE